MAPLTTRLVVLCLLVFPFIAAAAPYPVPATPVTPAAPAQLQPRQAPAASKRMGKRKVKKSAPMAKKDYSSFLCPGGSVACPVHVGDITPATVTSLQSSLDTLADWFKVGFECMELDTELNSCGGCLALGQGQDCSLIENAKATGCEDGHCQVYSCFDGYVVASDRQSCVKRGTATPATPVTAIGMDEQLVLR
ncbi:hypothetical protein BD324DRAFT_650324 [Kockovaella imperatae]|uniref:Protein CPL1-like domain-containing protein n=1 Tax=Kockovaella imperatae TaxID=4999 RepID=A0A1Y1UIA3_9TREE|nr:hypothetical protein BD324DRAFT_650324 [Kockovaella imperatae]ORX37778.1 hypothetical protein BD324DRAFT_650324 [Kockovaella imperatae]